MRKVASLTVTLACVGWIIILLHRSWPEVESTLRQVDLILVLISILLTAVANYLAFEGFHLLARGTDIGMLSRPQLGHFFFAAQLLKHLPGRIWGIGYQIANGRDAGSISTWITLNIGHMLLATYFALASSAFALALRSNLALAVTTVVVTLAIYFFAWAICRSTLVANLVNRVPTRIGSALTAAKDSFARCPAQTQMAILTVFIASWAVMFMVWGLFGLAHPGMSANDGMHTLALYMVAWFIGYITLISPSGLGIRELVFVGLAQSYPAEVIAYLALVGRFSLLASDLLLGVAFWPFAPNGRRNLNI